MTEPVHMPVRLSGGLPPILAMSLVLHISVAAVTAYWVLHQPHAAQAPFGAVGGMETQGMPHAPDANEAGLVVGEPAQADVPDWSDQPPELPSALSPGGAAWSLQVAQVADAPAADAGWLGPRTDTILGPGPRHRTRPGALAAGAVGPGGQGTAGSALGGPGTGPVPEAGNSLPFYPAEAVRCGWEGTVLLQIRILDDGSVADVFTLRSCGHEIMDCAAVDAVRAWHFKLTAIDGRAHACVATLPICFVLRT